MTISFFCKWKFFYILLLLHLFVLFTFSFTLLLLHLPHILTLLFDTQFLFIFYDPEGFFFFFSSNLEIHHHHHQVRTSLCHLLNSLDVGTGNCQRMSEKCLRKVAKHSLEVFLPNTIIIFSPSSLTIDKLLFYKSNLCPIIVNACNDNFFFLFSSLTQL